MSITRRDAVASLLLAAALPSRLRAQETHPLALGRPHTDFIQSQLAPSRVLGASNSQPGVTGTPLSYDAKGTRAVTVVFRFPANWSMTRPHYVNSDQEFLVLDGELEINGERYRSGDYAYLPAGFAHQSRSSGPGATLINFYEGEHLAFYEPTPAGMYKPEKLIRRLATEDMRWTRARDLALTSLGPDVRQKLLRHDPATGECTWLVEVAADRVGQREPQRSKVVHAAVEESFVLSGEVATPRGTMRRGAYVWRAPGQPRGPYGSRTGYQLLIRSKGGALATTASGSPEAPAWGANYDPQITASMRSFAFGTPDPAARY
ncbi:MAG: DUF4437 domain-containing protein [Gammaproteobacteria bacterium]|nr:DUF4437 domain-containing protein [Gammaproteobacteria bacterium]